MGKTVTFLSRLRATGAGKRNEGTPTPVVQTAIVTFDPTQASATAVRVGLSPTAGETFVLPKGSVVLRIIPLKVATGGASPTFDLGNSTTPDYLLDNASATSTVGTAITALNTTASTDRAAGGTTAAMTVTGRTGTGTAGTGNITLAIDYVVFDDGKADSAV